MQSTYLCMKVISTAKQENAAFSGLVTKVLGWLKWLYLDKVKGHPCSCMNFPVFNTSAALDVLWGSYNSSTYICSVFLFK